MKPFISSLKRNLHLFAISAALITQSTQAVIFDGGIDSANLGKGDWIYFVSEATNKLGGNVPSVINLATLMSWEKSQGINYIIVKAGTGSTNFTGGGAGPQFNATLVNAAHAADLKIFGYTRSYGSDVPGEINLATYCFNLGADGFVLDAEAEWESNKPWIGTNGPALAWQLGQGIKNLWPTKFLAHAPMPIISFHSSFPYKEFGYWCDTVMPQIYHFSFEMSPSAAIDWHDTEWNNFHASLTGTWTNAIKPLAPVGQVYGPLAPPAAATIPDKDVTEFIDYLSCDPNTATVGGYKGVNFWRADLHGSVQWANIMAGTIGDMPGVVNNIVIDNPDATVVGSWTTGTIATNEFGTNYRYKGLGTGAAYLQFTPNIVTPGDYKVYQWHTTGSNRSTGAVHVITFNGGTATVKVNQQINDAKWNLLGTFNFVTGTAGSVRVQDNHTDTGKVVIADGMKFVFVGSGILPPAAPSGLTATAISTSQINLSWTDNSNNEDAFIVLRSNTSGGPYSTITTLPANTTAHSDTGLNAGTTYYYVVRASNAGGSSANSNQASATTHLNAPAPPSNLTATAGRATQINLSWTDNSSNESSFIVARSLTSGGPYADITSLPANTTSFNNTGLTANTTYYYVVRASNSGGASANSNEASATTYETDLLIDNKSAIVVGAWSTGTSSVDKYGSDYRFIAQGTGANYVQFTPFIATAGNYEVQAWYPQGANRTTNAPYVITHTGGTTTVWVNQEVNGGQWNTLGVFNFAAGSTGNIRITDAFSEATQVVMADAIRLVVAAVPPPAAPSGLTATAVSSSRINLAWTDNSNNEDNFIVARSTTSGGPYTDIAVLSADSTSYGDLSLSPNTTYYYVVRARNTGGSSANSAQASATTFKAVHVHSITMSWVLAFGNNYRSRATVNVKDSAGANVANATVTGNFTGAINNSGRTGTTGSAGNAVVTSSSSIVSGTVTFTVTNITGTNMSYDSAANVVTSATHSR